MNTSIFKKVLVWVAALMLATSSAGAFASSRGQTALIAGVIGAFAGAVIGQQTGGQNGVLPGALIGGAAGAVIGSSAGYSNHDDRRYYGRRPVYYSQQPVRYAPRPVYRGNSGYRYGYGQNYRHDDRGYYGRRDYRR